MYTRLNNSYLYEKVPCSCQFLSRMGELMMWVWFCQNTIILTSEEKGTNEHSWSLYLRAMGNLNINFPRGLKNFHRP